MMTRLGMRQCSPDGWQSVFVDLRKDPEVMRKRLDDKWRNMLSYADRKNLRFVVETDEESFEWIVRQCSAMMLDKEMSDIPVSLYRNLRSQLYSNRHAGMVFQAFSGNERIAGLWIVPHGVTATYLLGWNGAIGRKMKANQFLLWQAMIYLKKAGYQWLDLGGIDEETFKMPMYFFSNTCTIATTFPFT
ncbi:MAG TPA: GNAT family N-acetyltransferase [Nitrospirales bacterium]|nr:GNAT family N-acetyltransferase [Nitrospirales bacterium]